ncbi:MAG: hypothetical protein KatS3mg126_1507 [Lysobacteraceae bacterium]|nr:MAG: hypothetical protein KatS3mg126_1507 [Xanthomonadaceae bacterium]
MDVKHTLIRKIGTGTASEHDRPHFDAVLDAGNTGSAVYADRGYPSKEREAALKANGFKPMIQRRAQRNRERSQRQQERNRRIAAVRAGRARVRIDREDGRQAAAHHRPGAGR